MSPEDLQRLLGRLSPQKRALLVATNGLSRGQMRLWLFDRMTAGGTAYNIPFGLRLKGRLDHAALRRAIGEIVRRHSVLRTTFPEIDGRPVQIVEPQVPVPLPVVDLAGVADPPGREALVQACFAAEARHPFDLARGPVLRCQVLRLAAREHVLLLTVHHIVFDGWSAEIFVCELSELYAAYAAGSPSTLPEPRLQYADFVRWQQAQERGGSLARRLEHWESKLAGAPQCIGLRTDRPRPAVQSFRGARRPVVLPGALANDLDELSRRLDASLFMVLLSAWAVLLHRWSGDEEIVISSPAAGRLLPELEGLIGFFVDSLLLRVDLRGNPSLADLLARVRTVVLEAHDNQGVSLEKLIEVLQVPRDPGYNPLSQVVFALQRPRSTRMSLPDLDLEALEVDPGSTQCDLNLSFARVDRGLEGSLRYATDLFEEGTIARMVEHYVEIARCFAERTDMRLDALRELLADQDRAALLRAGGRVEMRRRRNSRIPPDGGADESGQSPWSRA